MMKKNQKKKKNLGRKINDSCGGLTNNSFVYLLIGIYYEFYLENCLMRIFGRLGFRFSGINV